SPQPQPRFPPPRGRPLRDPLFLPCQSSDGYTTRVPEEQKLCHGIEVVTVKIAGKSMQHGAKTNARRDYEWEESRESQLSGIGINRGGGDAPPDARRQAHRLGLWFTAEDIARSLLPLSSATVAGTLLPRPVLIAAASISH